MRHFSNLQDSMKFASPCLFVDDIVQTMEFYKKAFNAEEKFFESWRFEKWRTGGKLNSTP